MAEVPVSATPVRSNLAHMLLQLKELPPEVVSDSLNRFVALEKTPQFLKDVKTSCESNTGAEAPVTSNSDSVSICIHIYMSD